MTFNQMVSSMSQKEGNYVVRVYDKYRGEHFLDSTANIKVLAFCKKSARFGVRQMLNIAGLKNARIGRAWKV